MKTFFVYMMTNRSRVVLYIGLTNNLERRVWEHQNHAVKGFTSKYKLDRLVYYENFPDAPLRDCAREGAERMAPREKERAGGDGQPFVARLGS